MKVAILNDWQRAVPTLRAWTKLAAHEVTVFDDAESDEARLAERLAPYEAIVLIRERTRITATLLERLPNLRLLVQTGKVGPHVDVEAAKARGIAVRDGTGSPVAPAELAWLLILAGLREFVPEVERLKAGRWQGHLGRAVAGRRLGLVGFGKIAQRLARYAAAFDMPVTVWGRDSTLARAREAGLDAVDALEALCAGCDVVSLHLRLNEGTRGLVGAQHLAAMRPGALFVNTSRAELVAPGALEAAARNGLKVAVDVFEQEPAGPALQAFLALPNVLASPHIGFVERDTYEKYLGEAFDHINSWT